MCRRGPAGEAEAASSSEGESSAEEEEVDEEALAARRAALRARSVETEFGRLPRAARPADRHCLSLRSVPFQRGCALCGCAGRSRSRRWRCWRRLRMPWTRWGSSNVCRL